MSSFIPKDFQPRPEDYQAQGVSQIPRDFLDVVVTPEFIEYWTELKERKLKKGKKDAWYTTWRNRARFLWKKKGSAWEENRHKYRQAGGEKKDLFDSVLSNIKPGENKHNPDRVKSGIHKINGSAIDCLETDAGRRDRRPSTKTDPGRGAAAAPMDPLEALRQAREILEGIK